MGTLNRERGIEEKIFTSIMYVWLLCVWLGCRYLVMYFVLCSCTAFVKADDVGTGAHMCYD